MNIHKSQLFWCKQKGYQVLTHCHIVIIKTYQSLYFLYNYSHYYCNIKTMMMLIIMTTVIFIYNNIHNSIYNIKKKNKKQHAYNIMMTMIWQELITTIYAVYMKNICVYIIIIIYVSPQLLVMVRPASRWITLQVCSTIHSCTTSGDKETDSRMQRKLRLPRELKSSLPTVMAQVIPVISTYNYNPIYKMYNPIEITSYN